MSRDAEAKNLRLYDRRTIERNIKKGLITRKDYEKFLKSLEDAKEKGVIGEEAPDLADEEANDNATDDSNDSPPSGMNSH